MNKNQLYNLSYFVTNFFILILIAVNIFIKKFDFTILMVIFLLINSILAYVKFILYSSDASLWLSIFFLFAGIFLILYSHYQLSTSKLFVLIYFSQILAFFFVYLNFNSKVLLFLFLTNFILFFPIFFYIFDFIVLNIFFIFIFICVIINLFMYFMFFKV